MFIYLELLTITQELDSHTNNYLEFKNYLE